MKFLYSTEDKVFIEILKDSLESNGIQCFIKNLDPPLAGEIPPVIAEPELWVMNDEKLVDAVELLDSELQNRQHKTKAWECKQCHEIIPGNYNMCWKCSATRS